MPHFLTTSRWPAVLALVSVMYGCGGGDTTSNPAPTPTPSPAPVTGPPAITGISPSPITVSAAPQTITFTGTNFQNGMTLVTTVPTFAFAVNKPPLQVVSSTSLQVPSIAIANQGTYTFQLQSPAGNSNVLSAAAQFRTAGSSWIPEGVRRAQTDPNGGGIANVVAIALRDGTWRLIYNTGVSVSSPDGLAWTTESPAHGIPRVDADGNAMQGTLPRLFKLSNGQHRLYYGCTTCTGGAAGIYSAISADEGLTWTPERGLRISFAQAGETIANAFFSGLSVVPTGDGRYRGYFSNQTPQILNDPLFVRSAVSSDLLNWTVEPGVRVGPGSTLTGQALHVKAIANADGSTSLYYWRPTTATPGVYLSTSADGLTFTKETQLESLGMGGDPEVVPVNGGLRIYYNWGDGTGGAIYSALNPTGALATTRQVVARVNEMAGVAARNQWQAVRALTDQVIDASSPVRLPMNHAARDRVFRAEDDFRRGQHRAIPESAAVDALNTLADALGAPAWTRTDANEFHAFRRSMKSDVPLVVGAASDGASELSEDMSPLEAVGVTLAFANRRLTDGRAPAALVIPYRFAIERWLGDERSVATLNAQAVLDRLGLRR